MVVEFYRTDHKIWFGVGLSFVILPGLILQIVQLLYFRFLSSPDESFNRCGFREDCMSSCLCSFQPSSASWANVRIFILCLKNFKKLWRGEGINSVTALDSSEGNSLNSEERLVLYNGLATYVEALFESAPQFVLQLYAMSVQEKPIEIIQIISLPISFLSLVWAFTVNEGLFYAEEIPFGLLSFENKVLRFVINMFILSSRLFAVTFFIVSYKWWIFIVFVSRVFLVTILFSTKFSCMRERTTADQVVGKFAIFTNLCFLAVILIIYSILYWLKDASFSDCVEDNEDCRQYFKKIQLPLKILAMIENLVMILCFCFSSYSNTWYAIPVTVCVVSLSIFNLVINIFCRRRRVQDININTTEKESIKEERDVHAVTEDTEATSC